VCMALKAVKAVLRNVVSLFPEEFFCQCVHIAQEEAQIRFAFVEAHQA